MKHAASVRSAVVIAAAILMSTTLGLPAAVGATTSVNGSGVYQKLVLANNQNAVVLKMYGPRAAADSCDWSVNATMRDVDGTRYTVTRACYGGEADGEDVYATSLSRGTTLKACGGLAFSYNDTADFYRFSIPRTCLTGLANRIKVTKSEMELNTPSINEAGPTPYVARG